MLTGSARADDENVIGDKAILIFLAVMITVCLFENLFLMLLTVGKLNHHCRMLKERRLFNNSTSITPGRRSSEMILSETRPSNQVQSVYSEETESLETCINCKEPVLRLRPTEKMVFCCKVKRDWVVSPNSAFGRFTRYYFGNLCFANLLLAVFALPSTLMVSLNLGFQQALSNETKTSKNQLSNEMCTCIEVAVTTLVMAMIVCLVQLTFDRLLAIIKPFHYDKIMTKKRAIIFIVLGWIFCFVVNIMPDVIKDKLLFPGNKNDSHDSDPEHKSNLSHTELSKCFYLGQHDNSGGHKYSVFFYFSLVYLFPILFMIISYVKLYTTALRLSRGGLPKIGKCAALPNGSSFEKEVEQVHRSKCMWNCCKAKECQKSVTGQNPQASPPKGKLTARIGEAKATLRAFWLVFTFSFLTFPYFFIMLRTEIMSEKSNYKEMSHEEIELQQHKMDYLRKAGMFLLYVNAVVTPTVYAYKDRVLRSRFCSVFFDSSQFSLDDEELSISPSQSRICAKCQSSTNRKRRRGSHLLS
ncbi:Adenosine receptor A2b [Cichlidogyrus casuarinus]|uniref:Adenosine receptor A2b n=1 Tax=Cichlidogyrus casuarinus TaxID=1844966 RepID=A0ABD2QB69_9PLAT